ncbi:MAG: hypothetical protein AAGF23_05895 [Acidobacteriota bacterium]
MKNFLPPALLIVALTGSAVDASTPTYLWTEGETPRAMGPADDWFCGLKLLQGFFRGAGEGVYISLDTEDAAGRLTLGGRSGVDDLAGEAFCIPASTGTIYSWSKGQPAVTMGPGEGQVCALTGVGGHFRGKGEQVRVEVKNGQWTLAGMANTDVLNATAACFPTDAARSFHGWRQGEPVKVLGTAATRECFLLSMAGAFKGEGERIFLAFEAGEWRLGGASNQHGVSTSAVCVD